MSAKAAPTIISAGAAHVLVLEALHAAAFADPARSGPAWTAAELDSLLALPGVWAQIALDAAGEPVGLALWRLVLDEAELLTLGTRPDRRGQGIGRALLQAGIAGLQAQGATRLFLEVAVTNNEAIYLYASMGFTSVGRRRDYYRHQGVSIDAELMMRMLGELERV